MEGKIGADHVIAALAGKQAGRVSREQLLRQGIGAKAHRLPAPARPAARRAPRCLRGRARGVERRGTLVGRAPRVRRGRGAEPHDGRHRLGAGDRRLRPGRGDGAALTATPPRGAPAQLALAPRARTDRAARYADHDAGADRPRPRVEALGPRLERLLDRGEQLRLLDLRDLRRALAEHPRRAGTPRLRRVLEGFAPTVTRSELEERFLELCAEQGLPRPEMNAVVAGFEVDAYWPRAKLVAELDGYAFHRSPEAFERDRSRDVALTLAGFRVIRLTWRSVTADADRTGAAIRRLLDASRVRLGSGGKLGAPRSQCPHREPLWRDERGFRNPSVRSAPMVRP